VLGTKFNVNTYKEEPTITTTLLEGSVRLTSHDSRLTDSDPKNETNAVHTSLILKPGQQGQLGENKLTLAANPDVEQAMAWKNGLFNFQNVELKAALRQIARWYDVEVVYTSQLPKIILGGGLGRDLKLSQVLTMLQGVGVKTKVENKKLYISE
jgi:transmembrane sensor